MATSSETVAASCWEQVTGFSVDVGQRVDFDNGFGAVVLTEGSQCWDDIRYAFESLGDFMITQLELAAGETLDDLEEEQIQEVADEGATLLGQATGVTAIIQ